MNAIGGKPHILDAIIIANIWNQDDKLAKTEDTVQKADSLVIPKVLKASNQTGMFANDGTLTHDGQGWIERCTGTCVRILNEGPSQRYCVRDG